VVFYLGSRVVMRIRLPKPAQVSAPLSASITPFTLTRENGDAFSSEQLKDGPWVASFLFTRCPNQCPALSERLRALQNTLPDRARLVSFTVDPAHDTPQELSSYARRFSADPARWLFLTGDPAVLKRVQTDLGLSTDEDPNLHSLRLVLIDARNRARGYYDSGEPEALARLQKDLKGLGVS
jgi:protein SCO1/2